MMRAVFVDRDGVLNAVVVKGGWPYPPASAADLTFLPGVRERLDELKRLEVLVVCVTNQPDVARRTVTRATVDEINARVKAEMPLDDLLVCYHDDQDRCDCRKPRPGLLLEAARRFGIDLRRSYMIGDRWKDVACGAAAGCTTTVFVDYGYSESYKGPPPTQTSATAAQAFDYVIGQLTSGCTR
jgi:D-glycero-D-manno-heptose 1,7-bisphosphate phosphatase